MATKEKKSEAKFASFTPASILRAAIKAVPAVRYALGVGGLAAVVAIVLVGWKLEAQSAIFGTLIVLIFMVGLVAFAALTGLGAGLRPLALFLAWSFLVLMVGVAILFVSCTFFDEPKTLPCLLRNECPGQNKNVPKQEAPSQESDSAAARGHDAATVTPSADESSHPVVGEPFARSVSSDLSNLRVEIEDPKQAIGLLGRISPKLDGKTVFCDTMHFSLVISHNHKGLTPIVINSIAVKSEELGEEDEKRLMGKCDIDVLSSRPFGIGERKTFVFTLNDKQVAGRYIESAEQDGAWPIDSDNILYGQKKTLLITLKPGEEPVNFSGFLETKVDHLRRVWFSISYDAAGPKMLNTNSILISR